LSGTTLPLLEGVQNLVRWGVCSVERAISLATEAPRNALNLPGIGPRQPASVLLRWHHDVQANDLTWRRCIASDTNKPAPPLEGPVYY
ncbi:MAG: hypothetical protein WA902_05395, partial [Thermosynechococcaceae cyanobacterium]